MSLVLRMVRILPFEYVKTSVDKENKFLKIKSMQHVLVQSGLWSRKSRRPTPTLTPGNFDYPTPTPTPTPTFSSISYLK